MVPSCSACTAFPIMRRAGSPFSIVLREKDTGRSRPRSEDTGSAAPHPMAAHRIDSRSIQARGRSADVREGVGAFLEKRPAIFPDRVSSDMPAFFPWWDEPVFE